MNTEEYLHSLTLDQLFEFLEATIRHNHYCPFACGCFKRWENRWIDTSDIQKAIVEKVLLDHLFATDNYK